MSCIAIIWMESTPYLAAGISELITRGHQVLLVEQQPTPAHVDLPDEGGLRRIPLSDAFNDPEFKTVDLALFCGWRQTSFLKLARRITGKRVLYFDTQYTGDFRQSLAALVAPVIRRHFDACFVPGERQVAYARNLGFSHSRVRTGALTYDPTYEALTMIHQTLNAPPANFIFVGRYAPEKGLTTLVEAYRSYRQEFEQPWGLTLVGGEPRPDLHAVGIRQLGILDVAGLAQELARAGAMILPSLREPYGVALLEGAAAGLPLISTFECGAASDILIDGWNGVLVPAGNVDSLAGAMRQISGSASSELASMGRRSRELARLRSPNLWAHGLEQLIAQVL